MSKSQSEYTPQFGDVLWRAYGAAGMDGRPVTIHYERWTVAKLTASKMWIEHEKGWGTPDRKCVSQALKYARRSKADALQALALRTFYRIGYAESELEAAREVFKACGVHIHTESTDPLFAKPGCEVCR